jgi:hypothetical protein
LTFSWISVFVLLRWWIPNHFPLLHLSINRSVSISSMFSWHNHEWKLPRNWTEVMSS